MFQMCQNSCKIIYGYGATQIIRDTLGVWSGCVWVRQALISKLLEVKSHVLSARIGFKRQSLSN